MIIFISFFDSMLFRKCMPFDAGIHRMVTSFYPPTPTTIQGAIRSLIISKNNVNFSDWENFIKYNKTENHLNNEKLLKLKDLIGDTESLGKLILKGPFIAKKLENNRFKLYFDVPLDLVKIRKKEENKIFKLEPIKVKSLNGKYNFVFNDDKLNFLPWSYRGLRVESFENYYISEDELKLYLLGEKIEKSNLLKKDEVYKIEKRPGIWREDRVTKEGMLYFADYVRVENDFGIIEEINFSDNNNVEIDDIGTFYFGGQTKVAKYEKIDIDPFENLNRIKNIIKDKINRYKNFKILFLTPVYLKDQYNLIDDVLLSKSELISMCIGKPLVIGGWDLAKNQPKIARKFIPAGSIYYFKLKNNEYLTDKEFDKFWLKSILKDNFNQYGYGITLCGVW